MGWKGLGKKSFRKMEKKWRNKLGITSKNKIGRALKKVQHLFSGGNSASSVSSSTSSQIQAGYQYNGKSISQLMGGY